MSERASLRLELEGSAATLTPARPRALDASGEQLATELRETIDELAATRDDAEGAAAFLEQRPAASEGA